MLNYVVLISITIYINYLFKNIFSTFNNYWRLLFNKYINNLAVILK